MSDNHAAPRVRITGWRPGLEKISMTQALREHLGLGMAEAKGCTDRVLDGKELVLHAPDRETAVALAAALEQLGANAVAEA